MQEHAADPTGLVATVRGDHSRKKNMAVSAPSATLSETINHTSIPHQNKLKDKKDTTVFPLTTPLAILEMLLPNHAGVNNLEKRHQRE